DHHQEVIEGAHSMIRLFLLPAVLIAVSPALAADKLAEEIAPYLDEQLIGLVHVDLARLDVDAPLSQLAKLGAPKQEIDKARKVIRETLEQLTRAGAKQAFVVLSLDDLPNQPPLFVIPLAKDADADALTKMLKGL